MKISEGFVLKKVAGEYVIVPVGGNVADFSAMITINESGAFIWDMLKNQNQKIDDVANEICKEYNVDFDTAKSDVEEFINILSKNKVIEND